MPTTNAQTPTVQVSVPVPTPVASPQVRKPRKREVQGTPGARATPNATSVQISRPQKPPVTAVVFPWTPAPKTPVVSYKKKGPQRYANRPRIPPHPLIQNTRLLYGLSLLMRGKRVPASLLPREEQSYREFHNTNSIRGLAKSAIQGDWTALAVLHDALEEENHPLKDLFNWRGAAAALPLDAAMEKYIGQRNSMMTNRTSPYRWNPELPETPVDDPLPENYHGSRREERSAIARNIYESITSGHRGVLAYHEADRLGEHLYSLTGTQYTPDQILGSVYRSIGRNSPKNLTRASSQENRPYISALDREMDADTRRMILEDAQTPHGRTLIAPVRQGYTIDLAGTQENRRHDRFIPHPEAKTLFSRSK